MRILFSHINKLKGFSKFAYLFSTSVALFILLFCLVLRFVLPLSTSFLFIARETIITAAGIFLIGLIISVFARFAQKPTD
ncbi:MAG: hypothetical protein IJE10_11465 [Clostridia bacterium]|nr:hypothetical protein [Clostridia bacterium]